MKIIRVDCNYVESEFAAAYLLIRNNRGLFIECNTNYAIPFLKQAAADAGLIPDQIDGLIITHIHLDHAGGAGLFLKEFPNARLFAHPKAARHAIDPQRLVDSATLVYGEAFMQKMYGDILPCDPARVTLVQDGETIDFQGTKLQTKHVRGHANHHFVVIEPETKTLFSGDSFGVSYPQVNDKHGGLLVLASTSPTDFDGEAAIQSINWILGQDLEQIALTHFGFIQKSDIQTAGAILKDEIRYSMELMKQIKAENLSEETACKRLINFITEYFKMRGITFDQDDLRHLDIDLKVNAQGIYYAAKKVSD